MATELLNAEAAIACIHSHTAGGGQVLGIDGLQVMPEGIMGRIDLILDLSSTPETAEAQAVEFVMANQAEDIMFDVVTGWPDNTR